MNYKFLLIFLLLISCKLSNYSGNSNKKLFYSSGFAYIYNENDYKNKTISKKFKTYELEIGHSNLKTGTIVKLINPENKKFLILKNKKKVNYPEFYTILVTEYVADILNLNKDNPFLEIQEIQKNKSFIAEKAKTHLEERKIYTKAPVEKVVIKNLNNKKKKNKITNNFNFSILIGEFYNVSTANLLKDRLIKDINYLNKKLNVKIAKKNQFQLISGPYNSINLLKKDYMLLKNFGFEELDILKNE